LFLTLYYLNLYFFKGTHYLNSLHNDSSTVEQETNIVVSNPNETYKEEEILEKSRQILEKSQIKNKQLAQQVRFFANFIKIIFVNF
jgi:hypothetical protein